MTLRPLRGERYAEAASSALINIITEELPFFDFVQAGKFYAEVMDDKSVQPSDIALLGCNDRYFLLTGLLNRKDAIHPWIYSRCREVEARPDGYLDLWARFHFKSSIITFAGCIQEVLCDPEIRIGIFSNTKHISSKFLSQIKGELEANEYLIDLYEDVLWRSPKAEAPTWSVEKGLTVRRTANPKEATIEAHGLIEGMPTGRHFPLHIYDDVITLANVTNPDQIQKATQAVEMADNLGDLAGTRKWFIGTRYHFGDTYGQLLADEVAIPRIYPATKDGSLDAFTKLKDGTQVSNLNLLTPERWEEIKKAQRSTIAAQMLQNPLAGQENMFQAAWLKPYWIRPAMMNVYIMADPSLGAHKTSDRTAIAVIGIDSNFNKYLLDGYCHRMQLSEKWSNLRDLYKKWSNMHGVQMVQVGYERYGQQADAQYFEERMKAEGIRFNIAELNWTRNRGGESKAHRVGRLEPDFRLGSFFVPAKVWHPNSAISPEIQAKIKEGRIEKPKDPTTAIWRVNDEGTTVVYSAYVTAHQLELRVQRPDAPQLWRLTQPLRRKDEDGNMYDLTRVMFDEYLFFPFSPRDDLVDAMSRIYDMDPTPAHVFEAPDFQSYPDD